MHEPIGDFAFQLCTSLTTVRIPSGVASIADYSYAFASCRSLTGVYFQGNAPTLGPDAYVFYDDNEVKVYYAPGTSGWSSTFGGVPAVMLNPPIPAGSLLVTIAPAAQSPRGAVAG